ncbi:hypothetical protein [Streptomyces parvus]|uniref:hypothetical protein n=1 Tax=Streptomyces parvus TaxID=66428 RepID=UPI003D71AF5F
MLGERSGSAADRAELPGGLLSADQSLDLVFTPAEAYRRREELTVRRRRMTQRQQLPLRISVRPGPVELIGFPYVLAILDLRD